VEGKGPIKDKSWAPWPLYFDNDSVLSQSCV
jgi:hypothetical protein